MGVTVRIGDKIPASEIKSGTNDGKAWGMAKVKADKGYNTITLWVDNVSDLDVTASVYKVDKILSITHNDRKYTTKNGEEKWVKDIHADVVLVPDAFTEVDDIKGFEKLSDDIPFN